jgi:hypothetical protein
MSSDLKLIIPGMLNMLPTLGLNQSDEFFIKNHLAHNAFINPVFFNHRYILPSPFIPLLHKYNMLVNQTPFARPLGTIVTLSEENAQESIEKAIKVVETAEKRVDEAKKAVADESDATKKAAVETQLETAKKSLEAAKNALEEAEKKLSE